MGNAEYMGKSTDFIINLTIMKGGNSQLCFDAMKDFVRCIKKTTCFETEKDTQFCLRFASPEECKPERMNYWICRASTIDPVNRWKRFREKPVPNKIPED